jgi:hypothetical protein
MGNVSGKDETDENGELDESELDEEEGSVTSSQRGFAPPLPGHVGRTRSGGSPPTSPGQSRSPRMFVPQVYSLWFGYPLYFYCVGFRF